jgi:hypothetical protein
MEVELSSSLRGARISKEHSGDKFADTPYKHSKVSPGQEGSIPALLGPIWVGGEGELS